MLAVVGLGLAAVVVAAAALLLRRGLRAEPDAVVRRLLVVGAGAKLLGTAVRYYVLEDVYGGGGDANRYLEVGRDLAPAIRSGSFPPQASETGTAFMEFLSGLLFAVAPPNVLVGFLAFSALAFVGAYLFLRAFQLAIPDGDHRRYAFLIFLVPTMVFWPSSLGKEAWLVFSLGVTTYGGARLLRRLPLGYLLAGMGLAGTYMVRPHMAALIAFSLTAGYLLRLRDPTVRRGTFAWLTGAALIGAGTVFVAVNFGAELPQNASTEGSTVDRVLAETDRRTSQGGSSFDSRPVRGPGDFLHAAVTVPFRPFPTEGHNLQAKIAGLEGVLLLGLVVGSGRRLRGLPRRLLRQPYVAMASLYCMGFIIAFSNVGNFGILTRQRAQLVPFLLVLLALPPPGRTAGQTPVPATRTRRRAPVRFEPVPPEPPARRP